MTNAGTVTSMVTDALGSTVLETSSAGTVTGRYQYEPYGATSLVSGTSTTAQQYTGRENDGTGLYYYRARYYQPGLGRFVSEDPIGVAGGANLYDYVRNSPLAYTDARGTLGALALIPIGQAAIDAATAYIAAKIISDAIAKSASGPYYAKPPGDAHDKNGAKAPGKPSADEGFEDPKSGEDWVPNPNPGAGGSSFGWRDRKGRVWCPTGQGGRAHGGPHWDVQDPKTGGNTNVKPGQNINDL